MTEPRGSSGRLAICLAIGVAFALALAPAAHADHSITVSSSAGGVTPVGDGYYRVSFNTQASSTQLCRNWADAADAHVTYDGETSQTAPVDRWSDQDPFNENETTVNFRWFYEIPANSRVTFASRVGCDTVNHIGAEGFGNPVEATTPPDDTCHGPDNRIAFIETRSGDDLGLTDTQLYHGQMIHVPEATDVEFGDGTYLELSKNDTIEVNCSDDARTLMNILTRQVTGILTGTYIDSLMSTPRTLIKHRGTEFRVEYEKKKERTTVKVQSGKVVVQAKRGSKKKVVAGKGETVVQVGKKAPKVVKK